MEADLLKILIVEDETAHAEAIQRAFKSAGSIAQFRVASSLSEYRLIVKEWRPDIAIMDLNLSDGRSSEVLTAPPENGPFPIVIMTSFGNEPIAVETIKAGALDYIVKSPETFAAMPRTLERVLREWKLLRERKGAETALKNSQRLLAETERMGTVGGWEFDIDSKNMTWTEEVYHIHEVESTYKPTVDEGINFYSPVSRPIIERAVQRAIEQGEPFDLELEIITAKGNPRHIHAIGKADMDHRKIFGFYQNITKRKQAEEALKNSEKFIKDILSSVGEAFVVVDREYRILTANRAYGEQVGKPLESVLGKHCYEILHHATQPCHEPESVCGCKRTFETGEPAFTVHTHTDDTGKQFQLEIKTYAMKDESGGVKSVIEVINDVTEKTALENQLRHAQKMEGIGTLAGGIAHDFNNILSTIIGYGHITLTKMPKNDPLRLNIEHMLESADRAAALTQSLLTFSRKQIIDRKPVDLNNILNKVEKFLVRVIGEDVVVRLVLAEGSVTIFADAGQLEQVFMNLATNARDAMPNGGLLTIETSVIELDNGFVAAHGYGKPGGYAMIAATDTGAGMNEETRKKIFEPFFTTKEVGKGTGLGLAMVYGIIKQHEGFINVYSEPGKGTTFRIYLPLIKVEAVAEKSLVVSEYPQGGTETILVAEDDANLRKLTMLILEQMGYTVIMANDGEEAVTKFMENKDRIQLLLFDIIMPKKSGREAYDEIRKVMPTLPVLFASGYSPDMLREKSLIEKGEAMIYKPMSPQNLLKKVRELLDLTGGALHENV